MAAPYRLEMSFWAPDVPVKVQGWREGTLEVDGYVHPGKWLNEDKVIADEVASRWRNLVDGQKWLAAGTRSFPDEPPAMFIRVVSEYDIATLGYRNVVECRTRARREGRLVPTLTREHPISETRVRLLVGRLLKDQRELLRGAKRKRPA